MGNNNEGGRARGSALVGSFNLSEQGDGMPDIGRESAAERAYCTSVCQQPNQTGIRGQPTPNTTAASYPNSGPLQPQVIPDSLTTLAQYLRHLRQECDTNVRGQNSSQTAGSHGVGAQDFHAASTGLGGLPTPASMAEVLMSIRQLLNEQIEECLLTEKAFLKQPKVFLSTKKTGKGNRPGKGGNRYWKYVGLGFKTPTEASKGTYIDKNCPFTGNVSIRGRILGLTCHSAKMITIIVRRNYLHYIKKYRRYEKRHSNIAAHFPAVSVWKKGIMLIIGQCRFNVLKVIPVGSAAGRKKAFTGMFNVLKVFQVGSAKGGKKAFTGM